ncbi:two-component system histidine kinase PnpS [Lentibacillus sp. Marseille-P4043]|uniref:two-component system histidine kinase PnpS n=1 Tax=Lentibacillus sp. Marseille-P4043 TaxID=2040293 RepID=UPI000D0AF5E9|nr:ATP-binding protein [Lentibacillus sp. Marseille-P4043]
MRALFSKPLRTYMIGILLLVIATGAVISQLTNAYIILFSVLIIEFIVLVIILLHVFEKYMKPIKKATRTVDELVKGNYRARIHHPAVGSVGELSSKINILARNLSELSIQEEMQEKQLFTVIDNTQSGLVLIDEKGYVHLVNRKFISMFGGTSRDYVGYLYYDVLENEKIHQTVQQTYLYEETVKVSFTQIKGLDKKYIEIVGAPIFNEKKMLKGSVLVFYDITELKKLEIMRKDFVANVSHELKTPITSIKGFAETLLDGAANDAATRENFLGIIFEESKRLQVLIEDLLTLSKLEKDEFRLHVTEVNMEELAHKVLPMIKQQAERKQIQLTVSLAEGLAIMADEDRIKQVILNLLANAISYTSEHGKISFMISEGEEHIRISVADTGIGIPQDAIPRIFERFYRVDKARSRNTGGTGLGLAIVKHIVEVHNGEIKAASELNKGTTFDVYIPKK